MKKILYLLLLIAGTSFAQTITFPDVNLKNKLLLLNLDTNSDGEIQVSEVAGVTTLDISYANITSLSGLENFQMLYSLDCSHNNITSINTNKIGDLTMLECSYNQLTTLDLTPLTKLQYVYTRYNQLQSINVAGMSTLTLFVCDNNKLQQLNVTDLVNLELLDIANNELPVIDLSKNTKLDTLYCSFNKFTYLDLRNLPLLEVLWVNYNQNTNAINHIDLRFNTKLKELFINGWCQQNCNDTDQLYSLDITGLKNIETLYVRNNKLSYLDLSGLPKLKSLSCENNLLPELNIKNGTDELYVDFSKNPLTTICCDDTQINTIQNMVTNNGQTCSVNSNCVSLSLPEEVCTDKTISIYPNPVSNILNVSTSNEIKTIELMDTTGKTIIIKNDNTLDMSGYSNGYYFVKVSTNIGVKVKEVIKK